MKCRLKNDDNRKGWGKYNNIDKYYGTQGGTQTNKTVNIHPRVISRSHKYSVVILDIMEANANIPTL